MDSKRIGHLARLAAAAATGRRDRIGALVRAALDDGVPAADLQEATLQVFLFAGYPRTIDAFEELAAALGDGPPPAPPIEPAPRDVPGRGRALFERIYARQAPAVLAKLEALHADFARYVIEDAYGQVLARPFLPVEEREAMAVAMLAALDLDAQLGSHVRGALRVGAGAGAVRAALRAAGEVVPLRPALVESVEELLARAAGSGEEE